MNILSYIPETISSWGTGQTIFGISHVYKENILNGMKNTLIGLNLMELGFALYSPAQTPTMLKLSLCANNAVIAVKGIGNVALGIRNHSLGQAVKGIAQVTFGVAATSVIASLDDKVIKRARVILTCAGIAGWYAWKGSEDFAGGKGIGKLLFGLAGLAVTACMVYSTIQSLTWTPDPPPEITLSQQQCQSFVETHKDELNQIYVTKWATGNWKKIGAGISKAAFTHPELPQGIIKIPNVLSWHTDDDLKAQFNNIRYAKDIASKNKYRYITIPDSHLVALENGNILCETKFEFDDFPPIDCKRAAELELADFVRNGRFCDISLFWGEGHNAGFLKGGCDIGVFDFDCKRG